MRTLAEIDLDIAKVTDEMKDVHGSPTEVYARIVGYYRSVRNWNRGKREEYNHRKLFVSDESQIAEHLPAETARHEQPASFAAHSEPQRAVTEPSDSAIHYEIFFRKTCPNCPAVKEYCANLPISGEQIDVDTEGGFRRAQEFGIYSAPTAIFFDNDGKEIARAHSVQEIRTLIPVKEPAVTA
ncbi:hypothetical protein K7I13_15230 [Brucepastera parasyntrophica]|uniref:thioredoxin family protein n=1 Tax=Brucepastera parasyntrophica TaxID=2880008 RepID=UPI00210DDBA8|nr:anaerobic ribonucleoside-triphosphate reductase [Brucepastera parasyntrophica]ULQ59778.1 hypothetical protein K7I13_15230 [Brucepastera parasyntrophica]